MNLLLWSYWIFKQQHGVLGPHKQPLEVHSVLY